MSNYPALFQPTIGYTILNSMQNMRHKKELWKSFGLLKNMKVPDSIISPPKKNLDLQDAINIQIPLCVKEVSQVPNWNHLYFTSTTKCPYNWRLLYFDCKSCLFYILLVDIVVLYTEFSGHLMKLSQNILFKVSSNKCSEQNSLILIQTIKTKTMEKGFKIRKD